jgi:hypothetical protein
MEVEVWRYAAGETATLGFLMKRGLTWECLCFTLEDEFRRSKVHGETRIPAGRYRVTLRAEGGMHGRYAARFPGMHKGMLWLRDVPGFKWVYLPVGNDDEDTLGCILLGWGRSESAKTLKESVRAYEWVYPLLAGAIESGQEVWLTVRDLDRASELPVPPSIADATSAAGSA